eukprot:TRINITY_DN5661_c0_g1_i3.p1 TRINITY_DN5661_c0_g1~~TRINITY_DN5661_c0_g1_i3.p1  ORF type:complete len:662 (-),score=132.18 TRINITY_DN5661_c0_g1_i3:62-2047(-)
MERGFSFKASLGEVGDKVKESSLGRHASGILFSLGFKPFSTESEPKMRSSSPIQHIQTPYRKSDSFIFGSSPLSLDKNPGSELYPTHDHFGLPLKPKDAPLYMTYLVKNEPMMAKQKFLFEKAFPDSILHEDSESIAQLMLTNLPSLISKGNSIPSSYRGLVWPTITSAFKRKKGNWRSSLGMKEQNGASEIFEMGPEISALDLQRIENAKEQIEKDIDRTFPAVELPSFQQNLREVLHWYCHTNPTLGYCQAMNFLAGGLLLFMSQTSSKVMLAMIVEDLLPGYFTENMGGCVIDTMVLDELIKLHLPSLHTHFSGIGLSMNLLCTPWLMCLFINTLPSTSAFHIWDLLFLYGSKVLFEVSLGVLRLHQKILLEQEDPVEVVFYVNDWLNKTWDPAHIVNAMFPLETKEIDDLRAKIKIDLENQNRLKAERKAVLDLQDQSHFEQKELLELFEKFSLLCVDRKELKIENPEEAPREIVLSSAGILEYKQFIAIMCSVFPNSTSSDPEATFARFFTVFDTNNDNSVDFRELACGLSLFCKGSMDEKIALCFKIFDQNNDKMLQREELCQMLLALHRMHHENDAGLVKEVKFFVDVLLKADTQNAGALSLEEFREAVFMHPFISKAFRVEQTPPPLRKAEKKPETLNNVEEWVIMDDKNNSV